MRADTGPKKLHFRALSLWKKGEDDDLYATVYVDAGLLLIVEGEGQPGIKFLRATNWAARLYEYEQFWRTHGRCPRENTRNRQSLPAEERRLGEWARYQRRFEERLTEFQRIRLRLSPAFAWDPLERNWARKMEACIQHLQCTHLLPFLNPEDRAEFLLARWLGWQLWHLKHGTLSAERAAQVGALFALAARKRTDTDSSTWNRRSAQYPQPGQ